MARFVPSLRAESGRSAAEKRVLRWLDRLDDDWTVVHSLGVVDHPFKRWAEIDVLVLGPPGMLVIEVKGGRVGRRDGVWSFTDRTGTTTRSREGPFDQAGSAHGAVRARLVRSGTLRRPQCSGYAVLIPDSTLDDPLGTPDGHMLLDASSAWGSPAQVLQQWCARWGSRTGQSDGLTPRDVRGIADALRGDLDPGAPDLSLVADDIEAEQTRATTEQQRLIGAAADNPRLVIDGRNGTGRPILALAEARRLASTGARVLLVTDAVPLVLTLAHAVTNESGVDIGIIDERADHVAIVDAGPNEPPSMPYDAVIVIDALGLADRYRSILDAYNAGGTQHGTWRLFTGGRSGPPDPPAFRLRLPVNCRNTRQIAVMASMLSRTELDVDVQVEGPAVSTSWWRDGPSHEDALHTELARLTASLAPERVVVVTSRTPTDPELRALATRSGLPMTHAIVPRVGEVRVLSAVDLAGLDTSAVVVTGVDTLQSAADRRLVDRACTRARAHLSLLLHDGVRDDYRKGAMWFGSMLTEGGRGTR